MVSLHIFFGSLIVIADESFKVQTGEIWYWYSS